MTKLSKTTPLWAQVAGVGAIVSLTCSMAHAAPIIGKIGVGTWDTQAEFADVKVVQGTKTLYQSNFASNMNGWTTSGGTWARQNGYLRQTGGGTPAMAWVGNTTWSDYTLTLKARKISGSEGFLITVGAPGDVESNWWNIAGWGNTKHALQMPGIISNDFAGSVQTNVWYNIKVQLSGNTIKCYLNGALIHDTARGIEASDRNARIQAILNSAGYQLLTQEEKDSLQELFNRSVYLGNAARDTFSAMPGVSTFNGLSAQAQVDIIRKVGAKRLTWNTGWGYGTDLNIDQQIIDSMDQAVMKYNSLGVFDKHLTANNSPGTPTADAGYDGQMRFGGSRNYRTALHEMGHTLGVGTASNWRNFFTNGVWTGMYANAQVKAYDGPDAVINDGGIHFWPYGLNYDNELSGDNDTRHVMVVAAMRRDMGISSTLWRPATTSIPNGTYRLTPRHAQLSALDALGFNNTNGAPVAIWAANGGINQQFLLDLQSDGTYSIRSAMTSNRAVELPNGVTTNGTKTQLWDNLGNAAQRWYFIPMGDNWYKIAPKNSMSKCFDVEGISSADGALVQSWDYLDGLNQQWSLTPVNLSSTQSATTQSATPSTNQS